MPSNRNGKVGFRNLTKPLQALLITLTLLGFVFLIWLMLLQGAVGNLATSTGEFLAKKFTLKEAPINADFGFDLPDMGWLGSLLTNGWTYIIAFAVIFGLKKLYKKLTGQRRNRRPAPTSS